MLVQVFITPYSIRLELYSGYNTRLSAVTSMWLLYIIQATLPDLNRPTNNHDIYYKNISIFFKSQCQGIL